MNRPILIAYQTLIGISDTLTGALLIVAPEFTLRLMGLHAPSDALVRGVRVEAVDDLQRVRVALDHAVDGDAGIAEAGPQDDSELCRQTLSLQRSSNLLQSGRRKICFRYGAETQSTVRNGIKKALTRRFQGGLCRRRYSSQPAKKPMPAALNSVNGSDRNRYSHILSPNIFV